jgi:lipopolysaccharide biosynthesis glycosyltransferase
MLSSKSTQKSVCTVVFATDSNYLRTFAVALYSTLLHADRNRTIKVVILGNGISAPQKERIERVVQRVRPGTYTEWRALENQLSGMEEIRNLSNTTWARLFIPQILGPDCDRLTYLDCDILVRDDVCQLNDVDLQGATVGVVRDYLVDSLGSRLGGSRVAVPDEFFGLPYFNAGVMVIDLKKFRDQAIPEKVLKVGADNPGKLPNLDQDALNAVLREKWLPLDLRWNVQVLLFRMHTFEDCQHYRNLLAQRPKLAGEAKIVHFVGTPKPWDHWSRIPFTGQWARALLRSGYYQPFEALRWALPWYAKRAFFLLRVKLGLIK